MNAIYSFIALNVHAQSLSHILVFVTPWTVAHHAPLSLAFPRQEHWNGLPFPSPGDLPNPGIKPESPAAPALADRFVTTESPGKPMALNWFPPFLWFWNLFEEVDFGPQSRASTFQPNIIVETILRSVTYEFLLTKFLNIFALKISSSGFCFYKYRKRKSVYREAKSAQPHFWLIMSTFFLR